MLMTWIVAISRKSKEYNFLSHKEGIKLKDFLFFFHFSPSLNFGVTRKKKKKEKVKVDHQIAPTERFDITFEKKKHKISKAVKKNLNMGLHY